MIPDNELVVVVTEKDDRVIGVDVAFGERAILECVLKWVRECWPGMESAGDVRDEVREYMRWRSKRAQVVIHRLSDLSGLDAYYKARRLLDRRNGISNLFKKQGPSDKPFDHTNS